jgi:plasmid stabilization system protein ParE
MKYRVVLTPAAEKNLSEIFRFIALDKAAVARTFVAELRAKIRTLSTAPQRCALAPENGLDDLEIRHLIHGSYRIIFLIDAPRVVVLQVRHGARRPIGEE